MSRHLEFRGLEVVYAHDFKPQADDDAVCCCGKPRAYHVEPDGYPRGWPRCAGGCGGPALDGKATCGDVSCAAVSSSGDAP